MKKSFMYAIMVRGQTYLKGIFYGFKDENDKKAEVKFTKENKENLIKFLENEKKACEMNLTLGKELDDFENLKYEDFMKMLNSFKVGKDIEEAKPVNEQFLYYLTL